MSVEWPDVSGGIIHLSIDYLHVKSFSCWLTFCLSSLRWWNVVAFMSIRTTRTWTRMKGEWRPPSSANTWFCCSKGVDVENLRGTYHIVTLRILWQGSNYCYIYWVLSACNIQPRNASILMELRNSYAEQSSWMIQNWRTGDDSWFWKSPGCWMNQVQGKMPLFEYADYEVMKNSVKLKLL